MTQFSFHTHSTFCDGKNEPEAYVIKAIELGMDALGFSSHAPLNDNIKWAMQEKDMANYITEINHLKEKYKDAIEIYLSLELDYIPEITESFHELKKSLDLDYTIGSVHMVKPIGEEDLWFLDGPDTNYAEGLQQLFEGDIKKAISAYYNQIIEMIVTQQPDVIGHVDKVKMNNKDRYFSESEDWYVELQNKTLDAIEQSGCIVEVNTRGKYKKKSQKLFPDDYFLNECVRRNIPLTISTDAHQPEELLKYFEDTRKYLKQIGVKELSVFHKGNWRKESI